jgi:hypothetical protein
MFVFIWHIATKTCSSCDEIFGSKPLRRPVVAHADLMDSGLLYFLWCVAACWLLRLLWD